jgi:hypothetical protein
MKKRICAALIAASAAFGLSGCVTDDGYGYGGVSLGYGGGYYAGDPYWGWYDDFYYPGTGYYIYDRGGGRHRWSDSQRRYWESRRGSRAGRENWSGFHSGVSGADRQSWQQRRDAWRAQQGGSANSQSWAARREAWRAQNQSQGQSGATSGWRGRGGGDWSGGHRRRHGN